MKTNGNDYLKNAGKKNIIKRCFSKFMMGHNYLTNTSKRLKYTQSDTKYFFRKYVQEIRCDIKGTKGEF